MSQQPFDDLDPHVPSSRRYTRPSQTLGILGSLMICGGCFVPAFSLPVLGGIALYQLELSDKLPIPFSCILIGGIGIIAFCMSLGRATNLLAWPALAALFVVGHYLAIAIWVTHHG